MARWMAVNSGALRKSAYFSHAARIGDMLLVSGQVGRGPSGKTAEDDIRAQTEQAFRNIEAILSEAGATLGDIVKTTNYLVRSEDYDGFNDVRQRLFPGLAPASATVIVKELILPEYLIEVEAVAVVGAEPTGALRG